MIDRPTNRCKGENIHARCMVHVHDMSFECGLPLLCFGYFWSNFPLIICNAISCPLYILIAIKGISTKLHTFVNRVMVLVYDALSHCAVECLKFRHNRLNRVQLTERTQNCI